jgi:hypothetical protein
MVEEEFYDLCTSSSTSCGDSPALSPDSSAFTTQQIQDLQFGKMNGRTHRANPNTICPPAQRRQSPFPCVSAIASLGIFCQQSD